MKFASALAAFALATTGFAQKPLTVTILHTNDLHAHIDPTVIRGKSFGGYARHSTLFKRIRATEKNVMLLNAGDVFQGTLFFNVYDGLADLVILNRLGYQAMTLGNHEFDKGPAPLLEFAKRASFPLLACNVDLSKEPELARLVKPYTIIEIEKQRIGIIGLITETTPEISTPGDTVGFAGHLEATQRAADELMKQGVNKIILMSHIGYDEDRQLATKLKGIDLIIGGHSHTPLGTPPIEGWRPSGGPYPTKVKDADGNEVLIVQAWEWGKVVGKIKLEFDAKGKLKKVHEAAPIVVGEEIPADPEIETIVDAFRRPIDAMANTPIGEVAEPMTDRFQVGMHMADSILMAGAKNGAQIAFMNPGGVRANMEQGKLTFGMASSIAPFRNTIVLIDLTGAELIQALNEVKGSVIPSRGFSIRLAGGAVRNASLNGAPIDPAKTYRIATLNFMAGGGDGWVTLKNAAKKIDTGLLDIDALVDYVKANSPLRRPTEARVIR